MVAVLLQSQASCPKQLKLMEDFLDSVCVCYVYTEILQAGWEKVINTFESQFRRCMTFNEYFR